MIIVQLLGGMGNQMFQYALGKHLAIKNNATLKLDTSTLLDWSPGRHLVNRSFDLDIFHFNAELATKKDISHYTTQLMTRREKVIFHLKRKMGVDPAFKEKSFCYDEAVLKLKGDQYLSGLWQSYKYFEGIDKIIRNDFQVKAPVENNSAAILQSILQTNSVCINIRRTDYVSVKQTADVLGFIGLEFYKDAIELLRSKVNELNIFVFSDDINWCKENLKTGSLPTTFVNHTHAGEKFGNYFQLMQACKHFIIPNSTFAWWAAWLNTSDKKIVIAPKKWMNDPSINTSDLIPASWIRI